MATSCSTAIPGRSDWIVIGISGVTCGGKTTLTNRLKKAVSPVYVFHQDQYFYPDDSPHHVRCENLDHNNYDILSALDMNSMYEDIRATMQGNARAHSANMDAEVKYTIPGKKFLVAEGFTVANYQPIADMFDLCYYFVLEYGECHLRRVLRVYDPPDIAGYFEQCVWPAHVHYRAQAERNPRIRMLDGTQPDVLQTVMADIKALPT